MLPGCDQQPTAPYENDLVLLNVTCGNCLRAWPHAPTQQSRALSTCTTRLTLAADNHGTAARHGRRPLNSSGTLHLKSHLARETLC